MNVEVKASNQVNDQISVLNLNAEVSEIFSAYHDAVMNNFLTYPLFEKLAAIHSGEFWNGITNGDILTTSRNMAAQFRQFASILK